MISIGPMTPPETASNGALSPEDQRRRMMIKMLQQPTQRSANPGGAEMAAGGLLDAIKGGMAGGFLQQAPPTFSEPGSAANGGWSTVAQKAPSSMFGGFKLPF